ncbi:MAG: 8-oxo-dGTP diphosphatase [Actinomycetota bacterium]|jgi:8-oxo-dGTP diphosphatase|nr:8-oxo-dGTP diphosphatase [Actinomycetota bacterium]
MIARMAHELPRSAVTVDLVLLTIRAGQLSALLVRRAIAPYEGRWALPGGFVQADEDLDAAAARELAEETGLQDLPVHLEQLRSYGAPGRDPRLRVVTVAYLGLGPDLPNPVAGSDAADARWTRASKLTDGQGRLAFDHARILADGLERARAKLEYTPLATGFCAPAFTVGELREVYETVWGVALDPRNFHRKVTTAEDFLEATGETTSRNGGRPAMLYRRGTAEMMMPPMLRPA